MTPTDGATEYTTCEGLLTQSSSTWPKTSVFEIVASGVSANKLVIGKPATTKDATNGFMDTTTLVGCLQHADMLCVSSPTFPDPDCFVSTTACE